MGTRGPSGPTGPKKPTAKPKGSPPPSKGGPKRAAAPPKLSPEELKMKAQREKIIGELYSSEDSYRSSLIKFMEDTKAYQSDPTIKAQRSQIAEMIIISKHLESEKSVSNIVSFLDVTIAASKVYEDYLVSYGDHLDGLQKTVAPGQLSNLSSIAIMPVQRLPRYVLLLKELVKNTPPNSPDSKLLNEKIAEIETATKNINAAIAKNETRKEIRSFIEKTPNIGQNIKAKIEQYLKADDLGKALIVYSYAQRLSKLQADKPSYFNIFQKDKETAYKALIKQVEALALDNKFSDEKNSGILAILDAIPKRNATKEQIEAASKKISEIKANATEEQIKVASKAIAQIQTKTSTLPPKPTTLPRLDKAPPKGIALPGLATKQPDQKAILTDFKSHRTPLAKPSSTTTEKPAPPTKRRP